MHWENVNTAQYQNLFFCGTTSGTTFSTVIFVLSWRGGPGSETSDCANVAQKSHEKTQDSSD